jgi:hypothetical protein
MSALSRIRSVWEKLLSEAETKAGVQFSPITLGGWSAGCQAVREILKTPRYYDLATRVLLIDGIHTGYASGKPGPQESQLETANLVDLVEIRARRDCRKETDDRPPIPKFSRAPSPAQRKRQTTW